MTSVPRARIRDLNAGSLGREGKFVLYGMVASRRARFNFGLQHALAIMTELSNRTFWVLGCYDQARGSERPVFGTE